MLSISSTLDLALFELPHCDTVPAIAGKRHLNAVHRDGDDVVTILADQLTLGKEFAQVAADPALDDLPEALVVLFDLEDHRRLPAARPADAGSYFYCTMRRGPLCHGQTGRRVSSHTPVASTAAEPVMLEGALVDFREGRIQVWYDPAKSETSKITDAIKGFGVKILTPDPPKR